MFSFRVMPVRLSFCFVLVGAPIHLHPPTYLPAFLFFGLALFTCLAQQLRTAYRVEIKRCHPDMAGSNEFRVKFLERKFQKLQACWDLFNAEQQGATATGGSTAAAAGAGAAGGGGGSSQAVRARARQRAGDEVLEQQAEAAAARRSRRPVMDRGRKILDDGNSSSC